MKALLILATLVAVGTHPAAAQQADGQTLYRQHCRTCHGATGRPTRIALREYPKIANLADSVFMAGISPDSIVAVIARGAGNGEQMKSFKGKLTHDEMVAVARYVLTLSAPRKSP